MFAKHEFYWLVRKFNGNMDKAWVEFVSMYPSSSEEVRRAVFLTAARWQKESEQRLAWDTDWKARHAQ